VRRLHLSLLALPLMLGACSITDSLSQQLNIINVSFSAANPASSGPALGGPTVASALVQLLTPVYLGGPTNQQILAEYYLTDTFFVQGDNTGNTDTARFGTQAIKPILLFRIDSPTATPDSVTIPPFVVPGGQIANLKFAVQVPLTSINASILHEIIAGTPIPFYLSGTVKFDLVTPLGSVEGSSQSELQLASGNIPTRPGSMDLSSLLSAMGL
jgi:hypothetical protein